MLALTAALGAFGAASASAADPFITIRPQQYVNGAYRTVNYFQIAARPGQSVRVGRIAIRNAGTQPVRVAVEPVDAITATNLGSAYKVPGLKPHGPALWAQVSTGRVNIPPKGTVSVALSTRVPTGAKGGDYLSGVSIEALGQSQQTKSGSNVAISAIRRYGVGVQTSLPGPRHPLVRFHGARVVYRPAGLTFLLNARNEGNVILQNVRGSAEVTRQGARILAQQILPGTFVTGTSIQYPLLDKQEQPPAGTTYRVKAVLRYPGGIARLNQLVTFGKQQERVEQQFLGPAFRDRQGHGLSAWLIAGIAALLLGASAAAIRVRHVRVGRRALTRVAGLAMLERELSTLAISDRFLRITIVTSIVEGERKRKKLVRGVSSQLGSEDAVCELSDGKLLIIESKPKGQPEDGSDGDLARYLAKLNGSGASAPKVKTAVANEPTTLAGLLERASETAG